MNSALTFDAHVKGNNWSIRRFYGAYPLNPVAPIELVRDTWYSLMPIWSPSGVSSIKVTTSANLTSAKLEFALARGRTPTTQAAFSADKEVLDAVIVDKDIATAVTASDLAWGTMFTTGKPDEYTWKELESLLTGFKDEDWSLLHLVYKITGADVPTGFYTKFTIEGYGETSS
jgi:hypothetical protein